MPGKNFINSFLPHLRNLNIHSNCSKPAIIAPQDAFLQMLLQRPQLFLLLTDASVPTFSFSPTPQHQRPSSNVRASKTQRPDRHAPQHRTSTHSLKFQPTAEAATAHRPLQLHPQETIDWQIPRLPANASSNDHNSRAHNSTAHNSEHPHPKAQPDHQAERSHPKHG